MNGNYCSDFVDLGYKRVSVDEIRGAGHYIIGETRIVVEKVKNCMCLCVPSVGMVGLAMPVKMISVPIDENFREEFQERP